MNKSERFSPLYIFNSQYHHSLSIRQYFVSSLFFAAAYLGNVQNSNFPIEDFSNHITETNGQFNAIYRQRTC